MFVAFLLLEGAVVAVVSLVAVAVAHVITVLVSYAQGTPLGGVVIGH